MGSLLSGNLLAFLVADWKAKNQKCAYAFLNYLIHDKKNETQSFGCFFTKSTLFSYAIVLEIISRLYSKTQGLNELSDSETVGGKLSKLVHLLWCDNSALT